MTHPIPYGTPPFKMALYVLVEHAQGAIALAANCSEPTAKRFCGKWNAETLTYQHCALRAVTKMILDKTAAVRQSGNCRPFDVHLYTNNANVAKAVTRAFILGREKHFKNLCPLRELKRRGKDLELYVPLVDAIADLYSVIGGCKQIGFVGIRAHFEELYRETRTQVAEMGLKVTKKSASSCTALNDGISMSW